MKIVKSRLARADILETAKYIADDNPQAALNFLDSVEATFSLIERQPKIGSPRRFEYTKLTGLRVW